MPYQGLGTHTSEEGCEYFKHIDNHKRVFVCDDDKDHGEAIDGAFNANSKYRKEMLENFDVRIYIYICSLLTIFGLLMLFFFSCAA